MKWLHRFLKGASFSGALFALQACYGVPEPPISRERGEAPMSFKVVSAKTGEPLEGIEVRSRARNSSYDNYWENESVTDADGVCFINLSYVRNIEGPFIRFEDVEGLYAPKDTTLADLRERTVYIEMTPIE